MGINSADALLNRKSPLMNLLETVKTGLETVKTGQEVYQGFKPDKMDDPDSPIMSAIRQGASESGIELKDGVTPRMAKDSGLLDMINNRVKEQSSLKVAMAKSRDEKKTAQRLPAEKITSVSEGKSIASMLNDINGTIEDNDDQFGPVMGRAYSMSPYNEKSNTIDAQLRTAAKVMGRYLENGKLTDNDEIKYKKMLPEISDTREVALNKLKMAQRLVKRKYLSEIKALSDSGYDTSGLDSDIGEVPDLPSVLMAGNKKTAEGQAIAAEPGPYGVSVVQNGVTFNWNPKTKRYEPKK